MPLTSDELKALASAIESEDTFSVSEFFARHRGKLNQRICDDRKYATPLYYAVQHGSRDVAFLLLKMSADPNKCVKIGNRKQCCLRFVSTIRFDAGLVIALLRAGADPCLGDQQGNCPLWDALIYASNSTTAERGKEVLTTFLKESLPEYRESMKAIFDKRANRLTLPTAVRDAFGNLQCETSS